MLLIANFVGPSAIEGVGVFAAEPIRKGDAIWRSDPTFDMLIPVATYRSAEPQLQQLLERYAYPSLDRPGFLVYETDNGRFMNHSATPNTDFSMFGVGEAVADIAAGEEITCNYDQFYIGFEAILASAQRHPPTAARLNGPGQPFRHLPG
jgi:SET domain-containing protein